MQHDFLNVAVQKESRTNISTRVAATIIPEKIAMVPKFNSFKAPARIPPIEWYVSELR